MLAIRMQRRGRKGHAQYRLVVQDKDLSPKSGRVVYNLGPYNPHTKEATIDKEKAKFYLDNGAQPSNTAAKLLKKEGVKLPKWVEIDTSFKGELKNPEKLRKNQPDEPAEEKAEPEADAPSEEEKPAEESTEDTKEDSKEETDKTEEEKPSEEPKAEAEEDKKEEQDK